MKKSSVNNITNGQKIPDVAAKYGITRQSIYYLIPNKSSSVKETNFEKSRSHHEKSKTS